jgi:hypothetical protein
MPQADVEFARGSTLAAVCVLLAITDATYFRWRKEYGGMTVDQARRLKALGQASASRALGQPRVMQRSTARVRDDESPLAGRIGKCCR